MSKLTIAVTKHDHLQGDLNAPCSLVEYGDYECPSCGEAQPVVKSLQAHFGQQLSFAFRNFPLRGIHPWAEPAAELAEYAGVHGRFWEMHDLLFANQERLSEHTFTVLAQKLGLTDSGPQLQQPDGAFKKELMLILLAAYGAASMQHQPSSSTEIGTMDLRITILSSHLEQVLIADGD